MDQKDIWKDQEKGKEEDYFMRKHREWLEKKRGKNVSARGEPGEPDASPLCPRCRKPLEARSLPSGRMLACGVCGGAWLDRNDLERVLDTRKRIE